MEAEAQMEGAVEWEAVSDTVGHWEMVVLWVAERVREVLAVSEEL